MSSLTIHAGPFKTGTSSVQEAFWANREALADLGILYSPVTNYPNHSDPVQEWLSEPFADDAVVQWHRQFARRRESLHRGSWARLIDNTNEHAGPVIWSSGRFAEFGHARISSLLEQLDGRPVRVVLFRRRLSEVLPSWYQQEAKTFVLPSFEQWARRSLGILATPRVNEYSWMQTDWVREQWESAGCDVVTVGSGRVAAEALNELMMTVVDNRGFAPELPRVNTSLSVTGVEAVQRYLRQCRPAFYAAGLGAYQPILASDSRAEDPSLGGRYRLRESAVGVVDDFWINPTGTRERLLQLLRGAAPITQIDIPEGHDVNAVSRELAARMTRRNGYQESKMWVADKARQLTRRRRPFRHEWSFDMSERIPVADDDAF